MIEETITHCQDDIVHARLHHIFERAIATHSEAQVSAVSAHYSRFASGELIAILLIYPSADGLHYLWIIEGIDMVPSSSIATIAGEESLIELSLEGHSEVIALRIERITWVGKMIFAILAHCGNEYIQSSEAGMPITGEIEIAIRTECRKHLIARSIYRFAEILHSHRSVSGQSHAPDVESSLSSRHITDEIEPLSIRGNGRMRIGGERVISDKKRSRLAPRSIRTLCGDYLCKARIGSI